jgi:MFS transporter, DHA1 family, inner membrane transport protein
MATDTFSADPSASKGGRLLPHEWRLLVLLAALQFTNNVDFMIMMPMGPKLMKIFDLSPQSFSWLVSSYTFAGAVSGFLASIFLDRFDRKKSLQFTYSFFILGTLGCALAPSYFWLLLFRLFAGLFGGILTAQIFSIVGDNIPASRRGRAMGIIMTAFSAAAVFGIPFCLWMAQYFSWHAPFMFLSIFSAVLWLGIQVEVPAQKSHLSPTASNINVIGGFAKILRTQNVPLALILVPFIMLGFFTMIPLLNPYLVNNVGVPEGKISVMYLLGGFATLFTSPIAGRAVDRLGSRRVFTLASLFIGPLLIMISRLHPVSLIIVFAHTTLLFVLGNGRMVSSMSLITGVVPPQIRGGFMSLSSSIQQVALGLASFVGGVMVTRSADGQLVGYHRAGYVALASSLIAIAIAWRIPPVEGARDTR